MPKRLTHEEFEERVIKSKGDNYVLLDKYINAKTKLRIKHLECGHTWSTLPAVMVNSKGCPNCNEMGGEMPKLTHEEFISRLDDTHCDINILEDYKGMKTKVKFEHTKCGNIWSTLPNSVLNSKVGCPKCAIDNQRLDYEEFERRIKEKDGNYEILGDYVNERTKILMKHVDCGHVWKTAPNSIYYNGCPKCSREKTNKNLKGVL